MRLKNYVITLAAALMSFFSFNSLGVVFLDNTSGGTGALSSSDGTFLSAGSDSWAATIFNVASGGGFDITDIKLGFRTGTAGNKTIHLALYNIDGSDLPTTQVGSYSYDITFNMAGTGATYYDFNSGNGFSGFSLSASTKYAIIIKGDDLNVGAHPNWTRLTTDAAPANTSYMTFVGYRYDANGGASWGSLYTQYYPAIEVQGTAVPEPREYALVFGLALAGFAVYRRLGTRAAAA